MAMWFGQYSTGSVVNDDNPAMAYIQPNTDTDDFLKLDGNDQAAAPWLGKLDACRGQIVPSANRVCAIIQCSGSCHDTAPPSQASVQSPIGTGFLVAPGVIFTNVHVAQELFQMTAGFPCRGGIVGWVTFHPGGTLAHDKTENFKIEKVLHAGVDNGVATPDIAMLKLAMPGNSPDRGTFNIDQTSAPVGTQERETLVIGYPGNTKDDPQTWEEAAAAKLFGSPSQLGIKRLSPGHRMYDVEDAELFLSHNCATLRGNSGSPVVDLETGHAVGIHVSGNVRANSRNWYIPFFAVTGFLKRCDTILQNANGTSAHSNSLLVVGSTRKKTAARSQLGAIGASADVPDFRDHPYNPALSAPRHHVKAIHLDSSNVLQQGNFSSCTACAVDAAIYLQRLKLETFGTNSTIRPPRLSTRMLYEMARLHDEIPGRDSSGSSLRGVIKGLFHNGAAPVQKNDWSSRRGKLSPWRLTFDAAKEARKVSINAYYRLRPRAQDYQSAISETGAVLASAFVHPGWQEPEKTDGRILLQPRGACGAHAFVMVGYDDEGFLVLNSSGPDWGMFEQDGNKLPGIAHWSYRDWAQNITDGWVISVGPSTADAFGLNGRFIPPSSPGEIQDTDTNAPRRHELIGHCIRVEDARLQDYGRYGADLGNIEETAKYLYAQSNPGIKGKPTESNSPRMSKYDHVLFIAPSESMNERSTMKFISATRNTFKRNRIYPVYLLVETGYADAFNDFGLSVLRTAERTLLRSSPYFKDLVTVSAQRFGTKLWSSYRTAVSRSFANATGPYKALAELVENSVRADLKTHFIGESAGSLVIANALEALDRAGMAVVPETTHLVAPLLTPPQHRIHFLERLANVGYKGKRKSRLALKSLYEIACAPTPTVVSGQGQELAFSWSAFASGLESPGGRAMHDHAVASLQPRLDGRNLFKSHLPNDQIMMNADTLNSIVSRIIGAQQPIYEWEPRDFW